MAKRTRTQSKAKRTTKKAKKTYSRAELTKYGSGVAQGLPQGQYVVLKYSSNINLSDAVTGVDYQLFRGNSIFDPDFTGIGHQPLGYDQWAGFYNQYQVNWARIDVIFSGQDYATATSRPSLVGIYANTSSAAPASLNSLCENPVSTYGYVGTIETGPKRLSLLCRTGDIIGDPRNIYDKDYTAAFGSNPTSQYFFNVVAQAESNTTVNVDARVTITYYCWLYDPVALTES